MTLISWRPDVSEKDIDCLKAIATKTQIFDVKEIEFLHEAIMDALHTQNEDNYQFLLAECDGLVTGFTCYGSIPATKQRYDLYWIVVDKTYQRHGIGQQLLAQTEQLVSQAGGIYLFAQTSGKNVYAGTRIFYERNNYLKVAEIPHYYQKDDAFILYQKQLRPE